MIARDQLRKGMRVYGDDYVGIVRYVDGNEAGIDRLDREPGGGKGGSWIIRYNGNGWGQDDKMGVLRPVKQNTFVRCGSCESMWKPAARKECPVCHCESIYYDEDIRRK